MSTNNESSDASSDNEESYTAEHAALNDIIENQRRELNRIKKHVTKPTSEDKPSVVKQVLINGKWVNAFAGKKGYVKYFDGKKIQTIRDKKLYEFLLNGDDETPTHETQTGYERFRKQDTKPITSSNGAYKIPITNTQTFLQILKNSIINYSWEATHPIML